MMVAANRGVTSDDPLAWLAGKSAAEPLRRFPRKTQKSSKQTRDYPAKASGLFAQAADGISITGPIARGSSH
jgi:hypothetical protein